jgi:hypothetical protein
MTFREIVVDHHFVAVVYQLFTNDTSDVAGAAGYENLHDLFPENPACSWGLS